MADAPHRSRSGGTRERLFKAAVRLFKAHGYEGTTVDRIVREAGVAKGTFFVHFATKDLVITELVRNQVRVARRARDEVLAAGSSPVEALREATMTLGRQAAEDRELTRAAAGGTSSGCGCATAGRDAGDTRAWAVWAVAGCLVVVRRRRSNP